MKLSSGFTLFVAASAFQLRVRREEDDAPVAVLETPGYSQYYAPGTIERGMEDPGERGKGQKGRPTKEDKNEKDHNKDRPSKDDKKAAKKEARKNKKAGKE